MSGYSVVQQGENTDDGKQERMAQGKSKTYGNVLSPEREINQGPQDGMKNVNSANTYDSRLTFSVPNKCCIYSWVYDRWDQV